MNNKLILTVSILFCTITLTAQNSCYNATRQLGIQAFNQGKYDEAIEHFTFSQKHCEDLPGNHDLAGWIKKCRDKINNPPPKAATTTTPQVSRSTSVQPAPPKQVFTVNGVSFEMIFVQGGTFTMGCTSEQSDCLDSESPTHRVTLSGYYMGKYQVTQKLWQAVMGTTIRQQRDLADRSWPLSGEGDDYPMYYINYNECEEFCSRLNKLLSGQLPEGYKFGLPTEAQWEYAARGGSKSRGYEYSGSNDIGSVAWYGYENNADKKTHAVGTKSPNELGLYDMSGNVWEWCQDWYGAYSSSPSTNPKGPDSGSSRVLRGGSWSINAQGCRVAFRSHNYPVNRFRHLGFRLSLVP